MRDQDLKKSSEEEEIPFFQKLYDRPFLWLILGMITMIIFYTGWGIIEIMRLKQAPLP